MKKLSPVNSEIIVAYDVFPVKARYSGCTYLGTDPCHWNVVKLVSGTIGDKESPWYLIDDSCHLMSLAKRLSRGLRGHYDLRSYTYVHTHIQLCMKGIDEVWHYITSSIKNLLIDSLWLRIHLRGFYLCFI